MLRSFKEGVLGCSDNLLRSVNLESRSAPESGWFHGAVRFAGVSLISRVPAPLALD